MLRKKYYTCLVNKSQKNNKSSLTDAVYIIVIRTNPIWARHPTYTHAALVFSFGSSPFSFSAGVLGCIRNETRIEVSALSVPFLPPFLLASH